MKYRNKNYLKKKILSLKVTLGKEKRKSRVCSSTLNPKECSDHILLHMDAKMT